MDDSNDTYPKPLPDRALVTLALGVTEVHSAVVVPVSDEDLILFYQDHLSDARRLEVMHAIANCDNTYERWINLVHTNELANELTQEVPGVQQHSESLIWQPGSETGSKTEESVELKKWDLFGRLNSWLRNDVDLINVFRLGGAMTLVAVVAVFLVPKMVQHPTVDELYEQYAMAGASLLPEKSINLSSGPENKSYSAMETELAKGIDAGFKEMALENLPAEWVIDSTRYLNTATNLGRGVESAYALGRVVALSLIQCKIANNNNYFKSAAPLIRKLAKQHGSLGHEIADSGSDRGDVCVTSEAILKLL